MTQENAVRWAIALVLALAAAALVWMTEWVEEEVPVPPRGEAATNSFYAVQALARRLGAQVSRKTSLDEMPPPGARLVLASRHWSMFPGREAQLRRWVEEGGELVLPGYMADDDMFEEWLPIVAREPEDDTPKAAASGPARPAAPRRANRVRDCRDISEPANLPPTYADGNLFRVCAYHSRRFQVAPDQPAASWWLGEPQGAEMLRLPMDKGSVTVIGPWQVLDNTHLLRGDNALVATAALQLRRGAQVWFVAEESREALPLWLWRTAWPALLLGLAALAAALWRAGARFGPLAAPAHGHRRSMSEQVRGTAQFLQRHDSGALHAAQLRALDECAARRLRAGGPLRGAQRLRTLAAATALDESALDHAMRPGRRNPAQLAIDLALLESARRRLDSAGPAVPAHPSNS